MKWLGFRSAFLSTVVKVGLKNKASQTTEPQLFYIVYYRQFIFINSHHGHPSNHPFRTQLSFHLLIQS